MRLQQHISGERVLEALQEHPQGLPKAALVELTGLSTNQVRVGLTWVRDVAAGQYTAPVTWTRDHGYQLKADSDILRAYEHSQLGTKLVGLTRLMRGTVGPHATLDPDDEWVQRAAHIITATCDSLKMLTESSMQPVRAQRR